MVKVSIITPCYNSVAFIGKTIESVQTQTFADWEHIVVDDGSTDGSAAVVEAYLAQDARLRLVRQPNGGVCNARNNGVKQCSPDSEYIYFMDADDCLEPHMLAAMTHYMDAHPEVGLAFCDGVCIDTEDRVVSDVDMPRFVPTRFGLRRLSEQEPDTPFVSLYCGAGRENIAFARKAVYQQTPGWDEHFGQPHEGEFFLHFTFISKVHFVPQKLHRYRLHATQNSSHANRINVSCQEAKKYAKWQAMRELTLEQRCLVVESERFRVGRLVPWSGLQAALQHLRHGKLPMAARFLCGAVRRYVVSLL